MDETGRKLTEECNLVRRGTHEVFRRDDNKVFVLDKDLKFGFFTLNAMTQAQDTAQDANDARNGCAGCPLYSECLPTPTVLSEYPVADLLVPAQSTSFE